MSERCSSLPADPWADATRAIHAARDGGYGDLPGAPVVEPIFQSANFGLTDAVIDDLRSSRGRQSYSHTRGGNHTTDSSGRGIPALQRAHQGAAVASRMI